MSGIPGAARRSPLVAVALALLCPGMGHLYAGHPARAFAVVAVTCLLLVPGALHLFTQPVSQGAGLRTPLALGLLALPALDAARLALSAAPRRGPHEGLAAIGLMGMAALLLALDFVVITSFWLVGMHLDRESGRPNLLPGDLVLVDVRPALVSTSGPGDLVVFEHPPASGRLHVKRYVASGGERVAVRGGQLEIDGESRSAESSDDLREEVLGDRRYQVRVGREPKADFGPIALPDGTFFALGDDRPVSRDSRSFGPLGTHLLRGRPLRVLWSTDPASGALRGSRIGLDPNGLP